MVDSNIANYSLPTLQISVGVIWKYLWLRADSYRLLKYREGCTIALFQSSAWCEKCFAARHYAVIGKQLLISNYINRVCRPVLGLAQDGVCNLSENGLKGDRSNDTKFNPPLFSLANTFKQEASRYLLILITSLDSTNRLNRNGFITFVAYTYIWVNWWGSCAIGLEPRWGYMRST